jgi:hypothetical protein
VKEERAQRDSIVLLKSEKVKKKHKQRRRFELSAIPPLNVEAAALLHQLLLINRPSFPFFL